MEKIAAIAMSVMLAVSGVAQAHDLKTLPLGDNKKSTAPKVGYLWPCHVDPAAGGATGVGPWIGTTTFDKTIKPIVPGSVAWPHALTTSVSGSLRKFTMNALPKHTTGVYPISSDTTAYQYDQNPHSIKKQSFTFSLNANPVKLASPTCAPGVVGILLTGGVLFNGLDAPGRDAVAHEVQDKCDGHPQTSGIYHYHNVSPCADKKPATAVHSSRLGYALDGFAIYGSYGVGGKKLSNANLDVCHGHTHNISWNGKTVSMYHYHATDEFPYSLGCMRGKYSQATMQLLSGPPPQ